MPFVVINVATRISLINTCNIFKIFIVTKRQWKYPLAFFTEKQYLNCHENHEKFLNVDHGDCLPKETSVNLDIWRSIKSQALEPVGHDRMT